jgi:hypothetical protein
MAFANAGARVVLVTCRTCCFSSIKRKCCLFSTRKGARRARENGIVSIYFSRDLRRQSRGFPAGRQNKCLRKLAHAPIVQNMKTTHRSNYTASRDNLRAVLVGVTLAPLAAAIGWLVFVLAFSF